MKGNSVKARISIAVLSILIGMIGILSTGFSVGINNKHKLIGGFCGSCVYSNTCAPFLHTSYDSNGKCLSDASTCESGGSIGNPGFFGTSYTLNNNGAPCEGLYYACFSSGKYFNMGTGYCGVKATCTSNSDSLCDDTGDDSHE